MRRVLNLPLLTTSPLHLAEVVDQCWTKVPRFLPTWWPRFTVPKCRRRLLAALARGTTSHQQPPSTHPVPRQVEVSASGRPERCCSMAKIPSTTWLLRSSHCIQNCKTTHELSVEGLHVPTGNVTSHLEEDPCKALFFTSFHLTITQSLMRAVQYVQVTLAGAMMSYGQSTTPPEFMH